MSLEANEPWCLTREALERLLHHLGDEPEAAGREYEKVRRKLLDFFERRGMLPSEALADETLDRVARKLAEGERVERLAAYVHGVAKHVAREWERCRAREQAAVETLRLLGAGADTFVEARADCLERCLSKLPLESRTLVVLYYHDDGSSSVEGRKALAERLGMTYTTLKTRAHRIRNRLEKCLKKCLEGQGSVTDDESGSQ